MRSRTRRLRAVALACLACAAAGGWSAFPAGGRPYVYLEGAPGAVLSDTVSIANTARRPERFTLLGADARATAGGSVAAREPADSTDAGTWIRFADALPVVPAGTRADVPFTLTVPGTAPPGDHPAAVLVKDATGRRAVVPLHLRVTGRPLPALGVGDVAVERAPDGGVIRYTLANRGNVPLTPSAAVRADGLLGTRWRPPVRRLPVLPPGARRAFTQAWPHPPALDRVSVRVTVTAAAAATASATAPYTAVPWRGLLAIAVGAAVAAAVVGRNRRSGGPRGKELQRDDGERESAGVAA